MSRPEPPICEICDRVKKPPGCRGMSPPNLCSEDCYGYSLEPNWPVEDEDAMESTARSDEDWRFIERDSERTGELAMYARALVELHHRIAQLEERLTQFSTKAPFRG